MLKKKSTLDNVTDRKYNSLMNDVGFVKKVKEKILNQTPKAFMVGVT
jgi:hypothetical protein